MDAGFFNMFHDAADIDISAIAQRVNIHFNGVVKEPVNQYRIVAGNNNRITHIAFQIRLDMNHFHGPPAQNIGRPDHHRQANALDDLARFFGRMRNAVFGLQ